MTHSGPINNNNFNNQYDGNNFSNHNDGLFTEENENKNNNLSQNAQERTLSHLTIKQICLGQIVSNNNGDDNLLMVDGKIVNQLMCYGTVLKIEHDLSHTVIILHDWTSRISVKFWNSDNNTLIKEKLDALKLSLCAWDTISY